VRAPVPVNIDGLDANGVATGLDERGRRWSVRGAIPGSLVLAGGRAAHGALLSVARPHVDAIPARCALFGTCGGCLYQSLPVSRQREEKLRALVALLGGCGAMRGTGGEGYGYRNKIELSFGPQRYMSRAEMASGATGEAGHFLGFHGPGRFDRVVDVPACAIADPRINEVLGRVRRDVHASPFPPYDPRSHAGFWRHLALRAGRDGVLALVYTAAGTAEHEAWLRVHAAGWGAAGVLWYTTDRPTDAAVGDLRQVLHGRDTLAAALGGATMVLSPTAFFQVNDQGAAVLLDTIASALGTGGTLLDLYAGVGALGLALAGRFDRVIGVELNAEAVAEANRNASSLGVAAEYRAGKVEELLAGVLAEAGRPVKVLVDPPRGGLHPAALRPLLHLDADTLVYVACRPSSLARDGAALEASGWRRDGWTAVDLFPHTAHVEVVARFTRDRSPACPPASGF